MVVKFLGVIAIFLVIQSWKDAAAGQLRQALQLKIRNRITFSATRFLHYP